LQNAVKYSGVTQFAVDVSSTADEIQLVVSDEGEGFDSEAARKNGGLGLLSMKERVNLVQGRFQVESRQGYGTKIIAVVPIQPATRNSQGEFDISQNRLDAALHP
jgi:signal transduction histidine kinase